MTILLLFLVGLVVGSFLSALTWRLPRGIDFVNDRSKCDKCNAKLFWYDNIPLLSYLLLRGKCRTCHKKISIRYPLIELFTSLLFISIYKFYINCALQGASLQGLTLQGQGETLCVYHTVLGYWTLPYLLMIASVMIAIFLTDFEYQIIPDEFIFLLFGLSMIIAPLFLRESMYERFFAGFLASTLLLLLHIFTRGRGMGLGDVKLALFAGSFLGLKDSISWLFLSFIIGALIGLVLILFKKAEFGRKIAFGPFLVISFFLVIFWGEKISLVLLPY